MLAQGLVSLTYVELDATTRRPARNHVMVLVMGDPRLFFPFALSFSLGRMDHSLTQRSFLAAEVVSARKL